MSIREDWKQKILPELTESIRHSNPSVDVEECFKTCYRLEQEDREYVCIVWGNPDCCMMFDVQTGEMVGLQPLVYLKEYGERL